MRIRPNKKPNRSKLQGFLVFAGKSIPSQQAVGISTQQTIKITIKSREQVFKEAAEAMGAVRRGETIPFHEEISFDNLETLRRALTPKRLELLHIIKLHHPESIYELAQLVQRDAKNVTEDLHYLQELGVLSLQHIHEDRERIKPLLETDKLQVEIAI